MTIGEPLGLPPHQSLEASHGPSVRPCPPPATLALPVALEPQASAQRYDTLPPLPAYVRSITVSLW